MMSADIVQINGKAEHSTEAAASRLAAYGDDPAILADVFREDVNMAIWRRSLTTELRNDIDQFAVANPLFASTMVVSRDRALAAANEALGRSDLTALSQDIAELVEMYCGLLGLERVGLRLAVLDEAMCPKFHVDWVPCRLLTTYRGIGTEWLQHAGVNRDCLGPNSGDQAELIRAGYDIEHLDIGDVALLKGEAWQGNAGGGLVHRSPAVTPGEYRLLLSLDVAG